MATVTLTTLRVLSRERADMVGSAFVADTATGLDRWINEGVQRLHEKLVEAYGEEYQESTAALTLIAGTSDYALPADFFKLYAIDLTITGLKRTLRPYTRAQRNTLANAISAWRSIPRYMLAGLNLRILPIPQAAASGTIYYAPVAATLTAGADTVVSLNGWVERYVPVYVAIQARMKEESDVRDLSMERDRLEAELDRLRVDRDLAAPKSATDMDELDIEWRW